MKTIFLTLLSVVTFLLPKNGDNGFTAADETTNSKGRVVHVATPKLDLYRPDGFKAPYPVVLVCPGGGYHWLSLPNEGVAVASFLNEKGIAAAVLHYRMPNGHADVPLNDACAAMLMLRDSAKVWQLQPKKIGVMGFSAGGHLAATLLTKYSTEAVRPDYGILYYPVISADQSIWHRGSFENLLGKDLSHADEWSPERLVTDKTPATLIVACGDDRTVPVENSVRMYQALQAKGVHAELLLMPSGDHGWGYERRIADHEVVDEVVNAFITRQTGYKPVVVKAQVSNKVKGTKPAGKKVPVIITAGQSNTDGRGFGSNQPRVLKQAVGENGIQNVLWSYGNPSGWQHTGGLGKMVPFIPASESMTGVSVGRWGYDALVYLKVSETLKDGEKLYVIKESAGGSSLATGIYAAGGRRWCVDKAYLDTAGIAGGLKNTVGGKGGLALAPALKANIKACIHAIVAEGNMPDIKCILWHQGETDHPEEAAKMYEQNITALIAYLREAVGEVMQEECGVSPKQYRKLPFVMGTVSHLSSQYSPYVEEGMYNAAKKNKNVWVVDLQDLPLQDDQLHFSSASMSKMADRYWAVLTEKGIF